MSRCGDGWDDEKEGINLISNLPWKVGKCVFDHLESQTLE